MQASGESFEILQSILPWLDSRKKFQHRIQQYIEDSDIGEDVVAKEFETPPNFEELYWVWKKFWFQFNLLI